MLLVKKIRILCSWAALGAALLPLGCGGPAAAPEEFLLRSGELQVTANDFREAFEVVQASHPGGLAPGSPEAEAARRRLLEELESELVLRRHAAATGAAVTPEELEAAVARIRRDYPEGVFERTLREAAIPFEVWKRRLAGRLLLEKLVARELAAAVEISPEEIAAHYERHFQGRAAAAVDEAALGRLNEILVADLRQRKIEAEVSGWIAALKSRYPVEVNADLRQRLIQPGRSAP